MKSSFLLFSLIFVMIFDNLAYSSNEINHGYIENRIPLNKSSRWSLVSKTGEVYTWPIKRVSEIEGDIILGGLHMIHQREDSLICGEIMPQGGIQALECMLYTIDWVNDQENFLPGITLGAYILDDCDKDTYGLEQAVDFIKGSISTIGDDSYQCVDGSRPIVVQKVISGVLGAASSVTSIQVANLLRLFKIPQISFFSTSPELSNKHRFEYFMRTVPSDTNQAKAMVDIVLLMNWTYISIIYEESNYGIKAFEVLEYLVAEHNICFAVKEKLTKDSGIAQQKVYDTIVYKLLSKPMARGVIVFASDQEVKELMQAVERNKATGKFLWIGSDGWSARALVFEGNEKQVEGTLSVQPMANEVKGFDEYFLSLNPKNNKRNPWFIEFWEHYFKCKWNGSQTTPFNQKYTRFCTSEEKMSYENGYEPEKQLKFVSDSVLAFGYALREMHANLCGGKPGLCSKMNPVDGVQLLKYLKKVHFRGLSGDEFKFTSSLDGPIRYNILHFKKTSPTTYEWIKVGKYEDGELVLDMKQVQFNTKRPNIPISICSAPCKAGQAKKYIKGEKCCWHCFNCGKYEILKFETECYACPNGSLPDKLHSVCTPIEEQYVNLKSYLIIGAVVFSACGILVTISIIYVFIKYNKTPVVRASGRELSFLLLFGLLSCYSLTFILMIKPNDFICGIEQTLIGACFSLVYSALLTKTNRILRIFNASKRTPKRLTFISPKSQFFIVFTLVLVQFIINFLWFSFFPPKAIPYYPTRDENYLICSSSYHANFFIPFFYPSLLITICTVYAILTRKIPEAFNESKYIAFTMYTTCILWLAFIPIYFTTKNEITMNITIISITISLSATVAIICLFSPKLYIILLKPEKNKRQSMITQNKYCASGNNCLAILTTTSNKVESATQSDEFRTEENIRSFVNLNSCGKVDISTQTNSLLQF